MVLENEYPMNSGSSDQGEQRSMESRRLSYQKIQESESTSPKNKRTREGRSLESGSSSSSSRGSNGSWGPVFKDRETFIDMHMC